MKSETTFTLFAISLGVNFVLAAYTFSLHTSQQDRVYEAERNTRITIHQALINGQCVELDYGGIAIEQCGNPRIIPMEIKSAE